jgi:hypothetical protein
MLTNSPIGGGTGPGPSPTPKTISQETVNCNGMCTNGDGSCLACSGDGGSPYLGGAGFSVAPDQNNDDCMYINGVHRCYSNPCVVSVTNGAVQNNAVDDTGQCIAVQPGGPTTGRHCSVGPSMYAVGDTLYPQNSPGGMTVKDINWLSNDGYMTGMMFKGSDNQIYVQPYYNDEGGIQFGASIGAFSGTYAGPTGWGPVLKWNGQMPAGTDVHKCFGSGEFIPGTSGQA